MDKMISTRRVAVTGGLIWLDARAAGSEGRRLTPSLSEAMDKLPCLLRAGNFNEGRKIHQTLAQSLWPNTYIRNCAMPTRQQSRERYLGMPIKQTIGTCALVACIMCLEAVHRFEHETVYGEGTFFIPRTRRADEALQKLLDACRSDGTWVKGRGANVGAVLDKIQAMSSKTTTNTPTCILPLRSWRMHRWDDDESSGTQLSPERVATLLDSHGPCVVVLWVCPWYFDCDAGRDDTMVYRGCGRSEDDREQSEKLYPDMVGWHAVVYFAYRFCGDQMHLLVLDNHDAATGPRRWIDVEEIDTLYTLSTKGCYHSTSAVPVTVNERKEGEIRGEEQTGHAA